MIALSRIAGENASFAQHFCQERLERTHFIVLFGNWALLQDNAAARFIHMQHLLLRLLSPIQLLAGASQGFAINRQMDVLLACLYH